MTDSESLLPVLCGIFGRTIKRADCQTKPLRGGTLGDVRLVWGTADGIPCKAVWKRQKRWERPGDPGSWRREYDLYQDFGAYFTPGFRPPQCYLSSLREGESELWLEYLEGVSGEALGIEMLELAALELGRFQGRIAACHPDLKLPLSDRGFLAREFAQWHRQTYSRNFLLSGSCRLPPFLKEMLRTGEIVLTGGKSFEYGYLRSPGCGLPQHLRHMLTDTDDRADGIFGALAPLPAVLCHRDFWHENIIYSGVGIGLIDWDTAGWGFPGEDMASLIADGMDPGRFEENCRRLIPAYLTGLSEYAGYIDVPFPEELHIVDQILIKFGYRMLQSYMFAESAEDKARAAGALEKIYELGRSR